MSLNNQNIFIINEVLGEKEGFITISDGFDMNPSLKFLLEKAEDIIFVVSASFPFKFKLNPKNKIIATSKGQQPLFKPTNYKKIVHITSAKKELILSFCTAPETRPFTLKHPPRLLHTPI